MGFVLYLIGAVIACFFSWKKYGKRMQDSLGSYDSWFEKTLFWVIAAITFCYPVAIPIMLLWRLLEIISNKLSK